MRKYEPIGEKWAEINRGQYNWLCECGMDGYVDLGEGVKNRYPCAKHYAEILLKKENQK